MTWGNFYLLGGAIILLIAGPVRAASTGDEGLGQKVKKLFAEPTPTPHKKHKASASPSPRKKASPKPSSSASPRHVKSSTARASPSPEETPAATTEPSQTPARAKHKKSSADSTKEASPHSKHKPTETPSEEDQTTPAPAKKSSKRHTPTPSPAPTPTPAATPEETGSPAKEKEGPSRVATISAAEVAGYENYTPTVRKILDGALSLTTRNLDYKYGSADPANGGMDCSGFINYVLSQNGVANVPRDAREQYIWVRKAGTFRAVLGHSDDTFELDALKPGDLLFWTGTYATEKDPNITHVMIYLGREKGRNQRVMVGSSDGRSYKGQSRFGVSVFDFKMKARKPAKPEEQGGPAFVGYARIPSLPEDR